ncbi:MAG: hypothetical protein Q9178_003344 [Gyalolechia marmorata]
MSFLNSVLSTIGGGDKQSQYVPETPSLPEPNLQRVGTNVVSKPRNIPVQPSPSTGQKRKAEDSLPAPKAKVSRDDQGQRQGNDIGLSAEVPAKKQVDGPSTSTSKSALTVPYRGTSRISPTSPSPDTPTTVPAKSGPPKKGSYAEIMARAAANNKPQVGVIKHKPKDKISAKKEIMMRKKGIHPDGKPGVKDARNGKSDSSSPVRSAANSKSPSLAGKKPLPQPSYKGTATPKPQPTYKGTMNMKAGSSIANTARRKDSKNDRSRSNSINPPRRSKEYESEEEEDEIDEEENGYSDSDDMEAGFTDVEEEETAATKAARKEDEEQLRIENQLKKEKEERRKRLVAMAAKAPKPKY